jgi:two-component system, chemotaxis family, protein-glutamate methylesterase/glutaminase
MQTKRVAHDFPVVCVGGSAGGLDAYTRLLGQLPADMGVAIVIVNHLRGHCLRL